MVRDTVAARLDLPGLRYPMMVLALVSVLAGTAHAQEPPPAPAAGTAGVAGAGPAEVGGQDQASPAREPALPDGTAAERPIVPGLGDGMGILDLEQEQLGAASATLPHDLSPWGMFMAADLVVKAVMVGLAFASVVTWTICLAKFLELAMARRRARRAAARLARAPDLGEALAGVASDDLVAGSLLSAAETELQMSEDLEAASDGKAGIKERVASRLDRIEAAVGRRMIRGTGVLATIGSTAPFVGLFGTVWGIMNSFIGISESQTTNLAVVAPGIAEALLATAIGLVAAIPAVVVYNHFARQISGYRALVGDMSAEVMRLVSRDLDRRGARGRGYARAAE
ncbi:tonB-system energizer ExbB [Geminicoccus harenae]|uniref:tonB-system energizer ExbB n=1 Tax=Geminicoccus harenae TaxID=2498453 RepID=UPI0027956BB8|nr:tonB-system energizer ExbB [Geminicoccus harenae]